MASATLTSLPNETLQLIFSTLSQHPSTAPDAYFRGTQQQRNEPSWHSLQCHTLSSLSLVSKRFRDIAQPILYGEFVPGYGDSWRSTYSWDGRLSSFPRTTARRPDLAALVKRIYIHPHLLDAVDDQRTRDGDGKKHLPAESQLLVQFLPAGIVSLHLEGDSGNLLPRLAEGLLGLADAVSRGRFPRLEQVRCDAGQVLDDYAVGSMSAAAGVGFDGDGFPLSNATLPRREMPIRRPSYSPEPMPLPEDDDLWI